MKRILSFVLLAVMLTGCAGTEKTEETQMQTVETTVETTEATTVATEPPTVFEKLGLTLWENADYAVSVPREEAAYPMTVGEYGQFGMYYYVQADDENGPTVATGIVDTNLYVSIIQYPCEAFTEEIPDMYIQKFYEQSVESTGEEISKEEWLKGFQNYKLIETTCFHNIPLAAVVSDAVTKSGINSWRYGWETYMVELVDRETGLNLEPTQNNNGEVVKVTVGENGNACEAMVIFDFSYAWSGEQFKNCSAQNRMLVLIPADYEDLAFQIYEFVEPQFIEDEPAEEPWRIGNIRDEEQDDRLKAYYFAMIEE